MNQTDYPWFYAPNLENQLEVTLDTEEQRHMKAQRIKRDEKVSLFNGKGFVAIGTLIDTNLIRLIDSVKIPKSEVSLAIAVAVPKGERADWMLQKLTELGISTIIPLKTERSVVLPREAKQERWQRILIEACKQSKQAWLPELLPLSTIEEALKHNADLKLLLDQEGKPIVEVLKKPVKHILTFIGPEGGFTDEEKQALQEAAGCIPASLGKQILRVETAAMATAAIIAAQSF